MTDEERLARIEEVLDKKTPSLSRTTSHWLVDRVRALMVERDALETKPRESVREVAEAAVAYTRAFYDEAIFPQRPPGRHSEVYDAEAAAVARLTCDNILREFRKRMANGDD